MLFFIADALAGLHIIQRAEEAVFSVDLTTQIEGFILAQIITAFAGKPKSHTKDFIMISGQPAAFKTSGLRTEAQFVQAVFGQCEIEDTAAAAFGTDLGFIDGIDQAEVDKREKTVHRLLVEVHSSVGTDIDPGGFVKAVEGIVFEPVGKDLEKSLVFGMPVDRGDPYL